MSDTLHHRSARAGGQTQEESPSRPSYSKTTKRTKKRSLGRILGFLALAVGMLMVGGGLFAQLRSSQSKKHTTNDDIDVSKICVNDPNLLPDLWRPPPGMHFEDSGLPWSQAEQAMADEAVETGLDELLNFYELNMTKSRVKEQCITTRPLWLQSRI
jgi:hypothetical protein